MNRVIRFHDPDYEIAYARLMAPVAAREAARMLGATSRNEPGGGAFKAAPYFLVRDCLGRAPKTIGQVCDETCLSETTTRRHLTALIAEGVAERTSVPTGIGHGMTHFYALKPGVRL